jgi:hypothetical protein
MDVMKEFERRMSSRDRELFNSLNSPFEIQAFLDSIPYSPEALDRCPLAVLEDRKGHCLDGGLFAAAALRRLGYPPLVIDMLPENDDDHVLAIFRKDGYYGALAKSNYVGLRFREPVYRSLRELVMSYFDQFYNTKGEKTLRGYTYPINLRSMDRYEWLWRNDHIEKIVERMGAIRHFHILTPEMRKNLCPVDKRLYESGLIGSDPEGLYVPE